MGLHRGDGRVHPAFVGEPVALPGVAGAASRHDVPPIVATAPGNRQQVVAGQALAGAEFALMAIAVLAGVFVPGEQEGVRHLPAELPGHVDELDQPDDCRFRERETHAPHLFPTLRLDDLGFAVDYQAEGPPKRDHRQGFK